MASHALENTLQLPRLDRHCRTVAGLRTANAMVNAVVPLLQLAIPMHQLLAHLHPVPFLPISPGDHPRDTHAGVGIECTRHVGVVHAGYSVQNFKTRVPS